MVSLKFQKNYIGGYTFGFNGKPKDDELYGEGNAYDFDARIYDPRIGRWLSADPLEEKYSFLSPYAYVNNNPIINKEINGEDFIVCIDQETKTVTIYTSIHTNSESHARAVAATNLIKQQANGKFVYNWIDADGVEQQYDIVFDFFVQQISAENETKYGSALYTARNEYNGQYENTFDVIDDLTSNRLSKFFGLYNNNQRLGTTVDNAVIGVRKSSEGQTQNDNSRPGTSIALDLIGDAHEILTHLLTGGIKKGMGNDGHTNGTGDMSNEGNNYGGSNVSISSVINTMKIIGAAMGNFQYKMGSGQISSKSNETYEDKTPDSSVNGGTPTGFNSGSVNYKP